jgi:hypothetical protein
MTIERFVKQLDGCTFTVKTADGSWVSSAGYNCTCASDAMFLYRATQGRTPTSSCHVRTLTGDRSGGTDLAQVNTVNQDAYGVYSGRRYQPGDASTLLNLVKSGRYGAIWDLSYSVVRGTTHDADRGNFGGNHAVYLSGPGKAVGTIRVGDPLADGRYPGCPDGFADWPESLLVNGAGKLLLRPGVTLNSDAGPGHAYAYLTPADPSLKTYSVQIAAGVFYRFFLNQDGTISHSEKHTTPGWAGPQPCSPPALHKWPGKVSRYLVRIGGKSAYAGWLVNRDAPRITVKETT